MPDAGRADPLPPYPSAPQSCRPPSCRRHSPAVLQGLGVLPSSVTAPDRHTARPASGVLRWPGDYRPALRSVAGHPACRRPGGRRVNTPPSSSLHQCSSQSRSHVITIHTAPTAADLAAAGPGVLPACSRSVRNCPSAPLLLCRLSPLRHPGPAPFALCLGHSPGAADPSHPAGCDPARALIRRRLSTRPRVDSRGGEGVQRRRHASRAHDRCWSDVCTLSGSAAPCASGRI